MKAEDIYHWVCWTIAITALLGAAILFAKPRIDRFQGQMYSAISRPHV